MLFRCALICLGAAAFCGATEITFDDINASGGSVALNTQYTGVTFGSDADSTAGCTTSGGCGFVVKDAATTASDTTETSPNFAALTGNNGATLTIDFSAPVTLTSIDLLGFSAGSSGFYDSATIDLFNSSSAQIGGAYNIAAESGGSSAVSPSTYNFNVANVSSITISKGSTNSGLFGFDDLTFVTSGIPEPASIFLMGGGMAALLFARRKFAKR